MSGPSITIRIDEEGQQLIAKLRAFPSEMLTAIRRGMDFAGDYASRKIQQERYTGKGPFPVIEGKLGVRTNRLRPSVRWSPARDYGGTIKGSMGSNVDYAGVHEYGYNGQVQVKAHIRTVSTTPANSSAALTLEQIFSGKKPRSKAKAKSKAVTRTEQVRTHTRWLQIPARAPLGHGLADHADDFTAAITTALRAAWTAKGATA